MFMEWSPASAAFAYTFRALPRPWLDTLSGSLGFFLVEKNVLPRDVLPPVDQELNRAAERAAGGEAAALAWLTMRSRAMKLGFGTVLNPPLARSPLVIEAQKALA